MHKAKISAREEFSVPTECTAHEQSFVLPSAAYEWLVGAGEWAMAALRLGYGTKGREVD